MSHLEDRRGRRPGELARPLLALWSTAISCCLGFGLMLTIVPEASAAPPPYRVGACLAAKDLPPPQRGETAMQYYKRTIKDLENIADAIKRKVPKNAMAVDYILLSSAPTMPAPRDCMRPNDKKRNYDIWLTLTYEEDGHFLYEVSQREGDELKLIDTSPDPWPDAARTQALLVAVGLRIVGQSMPPTPVPVEKVNDASKGIIFLYDSSGSMQETDHGARNRLSLGQTIGEIVANTAQAGTPPVPFAVVVFEDTAKALEHTPGSNWFETTPADLQAARTRLAAALKDMGNTNIEAAFNEVQRLMSSRQDIQHWNIVFLTDGEPTAGLTDYGKLTGLVRSVLGDKSTLSVVALHGKDPLHTEQEKLAGLVRAIMDHTGQSGEIINLKDGDDLAGFRSSIEKIAFLINRSSVRDEVALQCTHHARPKERVECELDKNKPHALRFGAAQKVMFIADTTSLPSGRCTVRIENQGLGSGPQTVQLPEGQPSEVVTQPGFKIALSRSTGRVFLMIEMTDGRVNGDWQIKLTVDAASGRAS
jgi:hypothetical protein